MHDFARSRTMMVDTQVRPNDVTRYPVIAAMLAVPREDFVPDHRRAVAYTGENLALGPGRVLVEPRTLAKLVDALNLTPSDLVLDLGCGYGYSAAVIARLAQAVVAVEDDTGMAAEAERRLAAAGVDNVAVVHGPLPEGCPGQAPYDAILINGAIEEMPEPLAAQLREGGRVGALFLDGALGVARIGVRVGDRLSWRYAFNAHAPLLAPFARPKGFTL